MKTHQLIYLHNVFIFIVLSDDISLLVANDGGMLASLLAQQRNAARANNALHSASAAAPRRTTSRAVLNFRELVHKTNKVRKEVTSATSSGKGKTEDGTSAKATAGSGG